MISFIIPTKNSARFLNETLDSINEESRRANCLIECIVVDDFSTDDTFSIVESHELDILFYQKDSSIYEAIDYGFRKSKGSILTWLNSDDILASDCLRVVNRIFNSYTEVTCLIGRNAFILNGRKIEYPLSPKRHENIRDGLCQPFGAGMIQQEGIFFTREAYFDANGLRLDLKLASDYHLWISLSKINRFHYIDKTMAYFRLHSSNSSALGRRKYLEEIGDSASYLSQAIALIRSIAIPFEIRYFAYENNEISIRKSWYFERIIHFKVLLNSVKRLFQRQAKTNQK